MSVDPIPIGKFSLMTRLSQKALRLYDRKGMLVPEAKNPFTGYRYYTVSQLEQGMKIKTLPGIKAISVIYKAPYQGVEANYNRIFAYAAEKNLEPLGSFGPSRELYLELYFNDPAEVPEEELMTEVQLPIEGNK